MSIYKVDAIQESNPNKDIGLTVEKTWFQDGIVESSNTSSKNLTIGSTYNAFIPNGYTVNSVITIAGKATVQG